MDEDDVAQALSDDYTRAEFIRDRLVPKAVLFFTGEALDDDGDVDVCKLSIHLHTVYSYTLYITLHIFRCNCVCFRELIIES